MTTSNNQLPIELQPTGDICLPVSVPNDTEWLWLLAKCLSFPTARRFWKAGNNADTKIVMDEWDSRVYNPLVERILNRDLCAEAGEDDCLEYPPNHGMVEYEPMSPFSDAGEVPAGYLLPPFTRYADLLLEDLPDWLADLVAEVTGEFTGYEPNDVLSLIGSFPLDITDWQGALTSGLPRFTVEVEDKGTLELHFLTVPFGGRALITVDTEPNIIDIFNEIIAGNVTIVELERDLSSFPPELNVEVIHEVAIDTSGAHVVHVTFVPALDATLVPARFGGGLRSVVWCSNNIPDEPCEECPEPTIEEVLENDEFFADEYIPKVFGEQFTGTEAKEAELTDDYDGTPQSIGSLIPIGTPNGTQKNALCFALQKFVSLYCSQKICTIQAKNFLEIAWNNMQSAINSMYELATDWMIIYSPNIFSCFVDDDEALTVLPDTTAQEDLACFLYDELQSVTMSQANFDAALLAAATTLTGNEQKIACVMNQDNALMLYLHFLEAYNTVLIRNSTQALDCPCETGLYRLWEWDFETQGQGEWIVDVLNPTRGTWEGTYWKGVDIGAVKDLVIQMDLEIWWRIHGMAFDIHRINGSNGVNDLRAQQFRIQRGSNTGLVINSSNFNGGSGNGDLRHGTNYGSSFYNTNYNQILFIARVNDNGASSEIRIKRVQILFDKDYAKGGYLVNSKDMSTYA